MKNDCCTICLLYPLITLVVSLVKVAIGITPLAIAIVGGMCGTALLLYPLDIFYLHRAIVTSPQFSWRLKALLIPFVLPLSIIWLAVVPIVSILVLLGFGVIYPFIETSCIIYGNDGSIVDSDTYGMTRAFLRRFWTDHYNDFYKYLESLLVQTDPPTFYDLKFKGLFVGLLLTLSTFVVSLVGFALICIIKVIPGMLRAWYWLTKNMFVAEGSVACLFLCPYIVAMALIPALSILAALIIMLGAPFYCAELALRKYYESDAQNGVLADAKTGALEAYNTLRDFDEFTNKVIFTNRWTILPRLAM